MAEGVPFGRYTIIKRLAVGGMAEVFLARVTDSAISRLVVLKRMLPGMMADPESGRMFLDEARIAAQLAHPFLIQVFDVGRVDEMLYIAMDYVHGVNLADLITAAKARNQPVPWTLAARLASYLCEVLEYVHDLKSVEGHPLNLIHRDVTPTNIMVTYTGTPRLVDFGIARAAQRMSQTQPGILKGKLLYAAPEQYRGIPVDARTDIYGLALCLYETLTFKNPFGHAVTPVEATSAVLNQPPVSVFAIRPDVPRKLAEVLHLALEKDPAKRPATAREFRIKLELALMEARATVGMPELGHWLAQLYPGRAAFNAPRQEGSNPQEKTQVETLPPGYPAEPTTAAPTAESSAVTLEPDAPTRAGGAPVLSSTEVPTSAARPGASPMQATVPVAAPFLPRHGTPAPGQLRHSPLPGQLRASLTPGRVLKDPFPKRIMPVVLLVGGVVIAFALTVFGAYWLSRRLSHPPPPVVRAP